MPSEFSDSGLDDFVVTSQDTVVDSPEADGDFTRPQKRRRLNGDAVTRKAIDETNEGQSSEYGSDDWDDDLSPPRHARRKSGFDDSDGEQISKYKIYVPKKTISVQENTFVSQTQPHSSPSHIRGPRWKKPDLQVRAIQQEVTPQTTTSNAAGEDDDDLRAAIEASLHSFEEENGTRPELIPELDISAQRARDTAQAAAPVRQDTSFDLDDIPEDAFDSSPCLSPQAEPSTKNFSHRPIQSQRTNLRQTTLFQLATRESTQAIRHVSPPPRDEPPTHHRLDKNELGTWVYPTNIGTIRDYQFNISQRGLFHNLLVALPTGLGKTFIAATVMLNWFRWTKDAQIVFTAPTKPLVTQQVAACLGIAGIPRSHTTLLTGNVPPGLRAEEWQTKRVFFMTPQTLINDLKTGIADPKRIVLLVVDEAHRATGGYAYVEVVKFLRRFNQSFRVLALTATPGASVEAVQAVIDGLDIARVEIRTEQSLDIREYVHARNVDVQTFTNSEEMSLCMDLMSKALQPSVDQLRNMNAYWGRDPMMLTAFGLTKARQQWMASDAGRNANFGLKGKVNALFTVLASLAHSLDLLKYHGIVPFYNHLVSFKSNTDGQKGGKTQRAIVQDDNFKKLMDHLQPWCRDIEFIGHPKLGYLRELVLNYFMDNGEGANGNGTSNTRVMIFAHFRDSAEEITRVLKRQEPIIRPHVFVGQASAKGSEGMDQKTQLSVIEKFKNGTYNTIVATSIGEEGLDIGEVDLIVCYDSSASPIRMLQRMGRTGRKRAGNIKLLLMQGKEEESYIKAKDNYEKMQELIASGTRFEFHNDKSARILPKDAKPTVDKRVVEIPLENSQADLPEPKKNKRAPKRPPKKFHMPDGVETGFTKASRIGEEGGDIRSLLQKGKAKTPEPKKGKTLPKPVEVVKVPSCEEVELTPEEERELDVRYRNIGGTTPQFICRPRNDAFPDLQRTHRPTKLVPHGSLTRRLVGALQRMEATLPDCDEKYESVIEDIRQKATKIPIRKDSSVTKNKKLKKSTPSDGLKPTKRNTTVRVRNHSPPRPVKAAQPDSPLMCTPYANEEDEENRKPFFVSQLSGMDESDIDFPDIETLARQVDATASRKSKSRPTVIDSDDDDNDDDFDFFN